MNSCYTVMDSRQELPTLFICYEDFTGNLSLEIFIMSHKRVQREVNLQMAYIKQFVIIFTVKFGNSIQFSAVA